MNIFIARNGQTLGPFDLATINAQLASGQLSPQDLAWSEGMTGWVPLVQLPGVQVPAQAPAPAQVATPVPPEVASPPLPTAPSLPASAPASPAAGNFLSPRLLLMGAGGLVLLLVLRPLMHFGFTVGVPVFFGLLLWCWNRPDRARRVLGASASKTNVRAGLGGAMVLCALLSSATKPAPSSNSIRIAGNVSPASPPDAAAPRNAVVAPPDATTRLHQRKAEERIQAADARLHQAEAAEKRVKRAQQKLAAQQNEQKAEAAGKVNTEEAPSSTGTKGSDDPLSSGGPVSPGSSGNVSVQNLDDIGPREVGTVDEVQYAIVSLERPRQIANQSADGTFVVLRMVAVNTAKKTHNLNTDLMQLLDDRARQFDASGKGQSALVMSGDPTVDLGLTAVQPDTPKAFSLVFDVPEEATGLHLKIPAGTLSLGRDAIIAAPKE